MPYKDKEKGKLKRALWRKNNKERTRKYDRTMGKRVKHEVLTHYSDKNYASCVDCEEWDIRCLSIDHINGGGKKHIPEVGGGRAMYYWLKRKGYPKGYDTVCMNCNFKRRFELSLNPSPQFPSVQTY